MKVIGFFLLGIISHSIHAQEATYTCLYSISLMDGQKLQVADTKEITIDDQDKFIKQKYNVKSIVVQQLAGDDVSVSWFLLNAGLFQFAESTSPNFGIFMNSYHLNYDEKIESELDLYDSVEPHYEGYRISREKFPDSIVLEEDSNTEKYFVMCTIKK